MCSWRRMILSLPKPLSRLAKQLPAATEMVEFMQIALKELECIKVRRKEGRKEGGRKEGGRSGRVRGVCGGERKLLIQRKLLIDRL